MNNRTAEEQLSGAQGLLSSHFKEYQRYFFLKFYSWSNTQKKGPLPALQMLDAPKTLEATIYHDGHARTQCFTLFHTIERHRGTILFLPDE